MPSIVQFMHPGRECGPDKPKLNNHKNWNTLNHRRKFLCSDGDYIKDNKLFKNKLMFWGEWEPTSHVKILNQNENPLNPKWLHTPYLPEPIPNSKDLQNTDPFIFENEFKYLLCQQFRQKPRLSQTQLAKHLDCGSLIIFGSIGNAKKPDAFFQLDTVFVVAKSIVYNPLKVPLNLPQISQSYFDIVYSKAFPSNQPDLDLCLYSGATFKNQINGMYSFVPSKLFNNKGIGFPRIGLTNRDVMYISNNLSQGFKITNGLCSKQIETIWQTIVKKSREQDCVEGIGFYF